VAAKTVVAGSDKGQKPSCSAAQGSHFTGDSMLP